jgi:hypothetical protein
VSSAVPLEGGLVAQSEAVRPVAGSSLSKFRSCRPPLSARDAPRAVECPDPQLSNELPAAAQTWVNQYLQFTHGYGLVMNFVSKTVSGGFPQYLLENVPAQSDLRA